MTSGSWPRRRPREGRVERRAEANVGAPERLPDVQPKDLVCAGSGRIHKGLSEMAMTVEELTRRFQIMEQEVMRAQQMATAAEQRAQAAEAKAQVSDHVLAQLAALPNAVMQAVSAPNQRGGGRQLIDPRGLGKPPAFRGTEADFQMWVKKTGNYILSVFPEAQEVLREAAESAVSFDVAVFYGATGMPPNHVLDEIDNQVYAVLMALTSDEPFDLVVGAGAGKGLEAWRRLHRRYDPSTVGRSRGLLREILTPGKSSVDALRHGVEKFEEKVRRYTERRDVNGARLVLSEDIRMAALESMLPDDLERHVQLNRSRLQDYNSLRNEVMLYAEARGTSIRPPKDVHSDAMDTSMLDKGGKSKKGKGKGNPGKDGKGSASLNLTVCWTCGKRGHASSACWQNQSGQSQRNPMSRTPTSTTPATTTRNPETMCWNCGKQGHLAKECRSPVKGAKGKSKGSKSRGRSTNALEQVEPEQETQEAWGLEVAALSLCALPGQERPDEESQGEWPGWICLNVDTGAAKTVFPENVRYGERRGEQKPLKFRTATGEIVPSSGSLTLRATGERNENLRFEGALAPVRKPLISAGDVTNKGNDMYYFGDEAYVILKGSKLQKIMRDAFIKAGKNEMQDAVMMYKEKNIYNMYVRTPGHLADSPVGSPGDICPLPSAPAAAAGPAAPGFHRQGKSL